MKFSSLVFIVLSFSRDRSGVEEPRCDPHHKTTGCLDFARHDRSWSKGIAHAHLWSEQVQAGIGNGLSSVGEMLVERSDRDVPVFINDVGDARSRKDVEREILPLPARHFVVAVDSAGAYTARNVGNESRVWLNEIVAK